jgi:nucleotide-binding universal stress UspA family protein
MENDIKKILVVSRSTKHCRQAVHQGISLARKYNAELTIVHIIHDPFGYAGWNVPMISLEKDYKRMIEEAKVDLDRMIREEKGKGLPIRELIREGDPTHEVLKIVNDEKIDLLIMSHYEETRLEHFLFCKSNEELIRKMPCSIQLVKNVLPTADW